MPSENPPTLRPAASASPTRSEHLVHARPRDAGGLRVDGEVGRGRATGMEAGCLEHGADGLQRVVELGVAPAADRRVAVRRADEAEEDPQRRGLARAVRAEEAGHLPGLDARGEAGDGRDGAEALGDT